MFMVRIIFFSYVFGIFFMWWKNFNFFVYYFYGIGFFFVIFIDRNGLFCFNFYLFIYCEEFFKIIKNNFFIFYCYCFWEIMFFFIEVII